MGGLEQQALDCTAKDIFVMESLACGIVGFGTFKVSD